MVSINHTDFVFYLCKNIKSLNFERFIAKHISSSKSDNYAKPVVLISFISIALGLALMIISIAVAVGFKNSISSKIIGFTSHIQIVPFDNNASLEERPITIQPELIKKQFQTLTSIIYNIVLKRLA